MSLLKKIENGCELGTEMLHQANEFSFKNFLQNGGFVQKSVEIAMTTPHLTPSENFYSFLATAYASLFILFIPAAITAAKSRKRYMS